jgi:hypothetical protein
MPGKRRRAGIYAAPLVCAALLLNGCTATLRDTYYLEAHDPSSGITNFFRIRIQGDASMSRTKYSVGFYDRAAVERLFGEMTIQKDFLGNRMDLLSLDNNEELTALASALKEARTAQAEQQKNHLHVASGTVAGLIVQYRTRFDAVQTKRWAPPLDQAEQAQIAADAEIDKDPDKAAGLLRKAQVILETIRIAVDGGVLVRSFDGAGNEVDTTTKTLVIFVASDVSRFANALRELAESEEASQNLMLALLGGKIQEAALAAKRVDASDTQTTALLKRLTDLIKEAQKIPAERDKKATAAELEEARKKDSTALVKSMRDTASALAGDGTSFTTADEIKGFANGLGGGQ